MLVSIITITYNSQKTLTQTLESVANQTYPNIEHIIIDGASTDDTLKIVAKFPHVAKVISEPDDGLYDALNKGINTASGEFIGILHSDDFFSNNYVLEKIAAEFDKEVDAIIGDVAFVKPANLNKITRYYSAAKWKPSKFKWGFMPPHPSFYLRKKHFQQFGQYQIDYEIASDYELMIRMLYKNKLCYKYIPEQMVTMRTGGISTKNLRSNYILNKEIVRGCAENGIYTNMFFLSLKYFTKIFELIRPTKHLEN